MHDGHAAKYVKPSRNTWNKNKEEEFLPPPPPPLLCTSGTSITGTTESYKGNGFDPIVVDYPTMMI
jgi:hypothetical protein